MIWPYSQTNPRAREKLKFYTNWKLRIFIKHLYCSKQHISKNATLTVKSNRQYLVCIVLFIVLLLLSKRLESVCRQVSNSHANYRQPWHLLAAITFLVQHCSLFLFLTNFTDWQQANLRQLVREYSFFHSNQLGGCQPGSRPCGWGLMWYCSYSFYHLTVKNMRV